MHFLVGRSAGLTPAGVWRREDIMSKCQIACLVAVILVVTGCTSDPDAPVNRTFPIRQMDRFFDSFSAQPAPRDYTHEPGYAPAYPAY
jgi:hypothetical protein